MRRPLLSSHSGKAAGFTLVEVSIAVGILAVALVALLGMMPAGLTNFRKAMDTSITAQIAQRVLLDMQQADFDTIVDAANASSGQSPTFSFRAPTRSNPQFRYFDDQGNELIPQNPAAANPLSTSQKAALVYQVNVRIMPTAPEPADPNAINGALALVTVQVARNPSGRTLTVNSAAGLNGNISTANLYSTDPKVNPGLQVYTYSALLGKNQG